MIRDMNPVNAAQYQCSAAEFTREYEARIGNEIREEQQHAVYLAALASANVSRRRLKLAEIIGEKAIIVNGERRFETRRLGNTTYLISERRDGDRRRS